MGVVVLAVTTIGSTPVTLETPPPPPPPVAEIIPVAETERPDPTIRGPLGLCRVFEGAE
jgi:hypothetical protein